MVTPSTPRRCIRPRGQYQCSSPGEHYCSVLSRVQLWATPWTATRASLSFWGVHLSMSHLFGLMHIHTEVLRAECWSGCHSLLQWTIPGRGQEKQKNVFISPRKALFLTLSLSSHCWGKCQRVVSYLCHTSVHYLGILLGHFALPSSESSLTSLEFCLRLHASTAVGVGWSLVRELRSCMPHVVWGPP